MSDMGNVWEVIHSVGYIGGDVAVASARAKDPKEWERAHYDALRNMQSCQKEAQRWSSIADELRAGLAKARDGVA